MGTSFKKDQAVRRGGQPCRPPPNEKKDLLDLANALVDVGNAFVDGFFLEHHQGVLFLDDVVALGDLVGHRGLIHAEMHAVQGILNVLGHSVGLSISVQHFLGVDSGQIAVAGDDLRAFFAADKLDELPDFFLVLG